jgi:hypothetical protein
MSKPQLPDVQYHLEKHSWRERVDRLLRAIEDAEAASTSVKG